MTPTRPSSVRSRDAPSSDSLLAIEGDNVRPKIPAPAQPDLVASAQTGVRGLAVAAGLLSLVGQPTSIPVLPQPLPQVTPASAGLRGPAGV